MGIVKYDQATATAVVTTCIQSYIKIHPLCVL